MKRIISLILAVLMILSLVACGKNMEPSWQEQYDLGVRYLSEGNYEEAIIAFTAAIEIDPKREEAYVGLADVYYATGDTAKAEEILSQISEQGDDTQNVVSVERTDHFDGSYSVAEYDASGNCVRVTQYNADGTVDCYWVSEYDAFGNEERLTFYNADGTVDEYLVFEYDASGNCERETHYNADDTVDYYWLAEFDDFGNVVRNTRYDADGTVREIYEYEGDVIRRGRWTSYNADGTVAAVEEF